MLILTKLQHQISIFLVSKKEKIKMAEINRKRKSDGSKSDVATHSDSFKKSRRLQCDFCNRAFNKSGNKTLKFPIRVSVI